MMARSQVLLCACPDLKVEVQDLAQRLTQAGLKIQVSPPLCTPAGLQEQGARLQAEPGEWLVAACGPAQHQGLFQRLAGEEILPVVNLLEEDHLESAVAAIP
ncbi:MAG: hypothetical protein P8X49_15735, partial [Syntrophobacterales bacterium]